MKVLVIGGGGREHALCWKLAQSPGVQQLFCAPGNAGIAELALCLPISVDDVEGLSHFAQSQGINLTIVGPEAPLVAGIVDRFKEKGLAIFGPTRAAAQIEGSKAFAKAFMHKHGIPTAPYQIFADYSEAMSALKAIQFPMLIKASGLAGGKGAYVCETPAEAEQRLRKLLLEGDLGGAGSSVVIEKYLKGEEASLFVITDGRDYLCLPAVKDFKRLLDGDQGPNTGGMGSIAPHPSITSEIQSRIEEEILRPTLAGLRQEGIPFNGCLYLGLMLCADGIKVLEYNCRFGDPEAQALLPLLKSDLLELILAAQEERLGETHLELNPGAAVCVILAAQGYPGKSEIDKPISGLDKLPQSVTAFHAGTKREEGKLLSSGGRVVGITALGKTLEEAARRAYRSAEKVRFEGKIFRRDIGGGIV